MLKRMRLFLVVASLMLTTNVNAQVTTASMSGKVTASGEPIIGATVLAIHEPSGTRYGAITNFDGNYNLQAMRVGGPYKIEVAYVGYQTAIYTNINLQLGDAQSLNVSLKESTELLDEVVIVGSAASNMKSDRSGAVMNANREMIIATPTVSRSMNDVMRLSPQGADVGNGFAVGGGNYRQSFVTVDGAAFNNTFGMGSNLPGNGSPISLDALEQITVSVTPYDVRQSGFTGGAINAVTRSGDNDFRGTAYMYLNNEQLLGRKVGDTKLNRSDSQNYTYGASIGGPIIKDKLFFFVNGEYEDNTTAGPSTRPRNSESESFGTGGVNRPLKSDLDMMSQYLINTYNYNPGAYSGYSLETPAYRILARLDWNINNNNRVNVRFSTTHTKDSNSPSSSVSPLTGDMLYPGGGDITEKGNYNAGRTSKYAMYFQNSRYYQERNFSSIAGEWNSRLSGGKMNNMLRFAYSYQDEPRSYDGGTFPTVEILKDGASYAYFGTEFFTQGNLRQTKVFSITDEFNWNIGAHKLLGGFQYEHTNAVNGYMQGGNGYYLYSSWDDFVNNAKPAAFAITHSNSKDLSQFKSEMDFQQFSLYLQDEMTLSENFKLSAGVRFELPTYPSLKDNYNANFAALDFGGTKYSTDQVPDAKLSVSPRVGFNWDMTGERKYVLRGGTGIFVGRLPFVWLVSAVGNSNVGQTQTFYSSQAEAVQKGIVQPSFHTNTQDLLKELYGGNFQPQDMPAPSSPTIIDEDLKMPSTWKTSLAADIKLPWGIDMTLEGIYNYDLNPVVVTNKGYKPADPSSTIQLSPYDTRYTYSQYNGKNAYLIENGKKGTYYYSLSAQLRKAFDFGLDLSFAYTHSRARSYGDGIGDQVTSAFGTNTYSVNGTNEHEKGFGTYVAPDRIIATIGYRKEYAKNFATSVSLLYEGMQMGSVGGYTYARYSYTLGATVVGDRGSQNLLYIPGSREELNNWNFKGTDTYSADEQRNDFWAYINQDDYLKKHKGEYAERGGAIMPWHHQFDFKLNQDFYINVGGKRNTLQLGVDIKNLGNMLNSDWGLYKEVNSMSPVVYDTKTNTYSMTTLNKGKDKLTKTYKDYASFRSTYSVQFSIRYIFN